MFEIASPKRIVNRRRHLRIRARGTRGALKVAGEEHTVEIVDYSKSGLKLLSPLLLASGTLVEVATDYVTGGMNIFKLARIVKMYRRPERDFPGE